MDIHTFFPVLEKYNFWNHQNIDAGFERPDYMRQVSSYLGNNLIKVVLGQRRCGKSYLLKAVIKNLITEQAISPAQILYINMDIYEFLRIRNANDLITTIDIYRKKINPSKKAYIFLDEIQEIKDWEKAVNSLSQDHTFECEMFITGSNANLLSTELSTYLSGRYVVFSVFPFSLTEYCGAKSLQKGAETLLDYMKNGGMPETLFLDKRLKQNYLAALKDSIILKDIVQRHRLRDSFLLERIYDLIIDSVGSMFSVHSIVKHLKARGYKTNPETVGSYIKFLIQSMCIHECSRYDIRGKAILTGEKKYYLNDLGFKYYQTLSFDFAVGRYLENAVYLSLKRQGYSVQVGKIYNLEVDFVAEKQGRKMYIQVAYLLADENVILREFGNLEKISDNYPKYVVSMDPVSLGSRSGIEHVPAWDFMDSLYPIARPKET